MSDPAPLLDPLAPKFPPGMKDLPYDDGEPLESENHVLQMHLLGETLGMHVADRPDVFVGCNMAVYYSAIQTVKNEFRAPDFFVVLGARPRPYPEGRLSWVVWEEERAPDLVIELLSASTEHVDRGRKMTIYARAMKVREYYLFDPRDFRFEGYTLDPDRGEYVPRPFDPDGSIFSTVLGLRLFVAEGTYRNFRSRWLRFSLPDGTILPTGVEVSHTERQRAEGERQTAERERQTAERERQTAERERQRADRLAAQLRAAGIEPE